MRHVVVCVPCWILFVQLDCVHIFLQRAMQRLTTSNQTDKCGQIGQSTGEIGPRRHGLNTRNDGFPTRLVTLCFHRGATRRSVIDLPYRATLNNMPETIIGPFCTSIIASSRGGCSKGVPKTRVIIPVRGQLNAVDAAHAVQARYARFYLLVAEYI